MHKKQLAWAYLALCAVLGFHFAAWKLLGFLSVVIVGGLLFFALIFSLLIVTGQDR